MNAIKERLTQGNNRFATGAAKEHFLPEQRAQFLEGQSPYAVVVACSDSRVPVETIFDADMGELFIVRTAGHVLADASKASIRFALEGLKTKCVVVLGHEDCSAVKAALSDDAPEWFAPVTTHVNPTPGSTLAHAVDAHVLDTCAEIDEWLERVGINDVNVFGGAYEITSGRVHWLS